jgi:hypothetical protein
MQAPHSKNKSLIFASFRKQAKIGTYHKRWGRVVINFINNVFSRDYQAIGNLRQGLPYRWMEHLILPITTGGGF